MPTGLFALYSGCGSDSRLVSSWMSTATLVSASACMRPWCAQNSSSPPLVSSTRTYAWAPQRSQTSRAVSGLVGAIAPVNVACLASCLRLYVRLAPVSFLTAQCNTYPGGGVPHSTCVRHKRNHLRRSALTWDLPTLRLLKHSSVVSRGFPAGDAAWHTHGSRGGRLGFVQAPTGPRHLFGDTYPLSVVSLEI